MTATTPPKTFDEVERKQRKRGAGCPRCGSAENQGVVSTHLQELPLAKGRRVRSKTVSLCEPCAVAVYLEIEALLLETTGIGRLNK